MRRLVADIEIPLGFVREDLEALAERQGFAEDSYEIVNVAIPMDRGASRLHVRCYSYYIVTDIVDFVS